MSDPCGNSLHDAVKSFLDTAKETVKAFLYSGIVDVYISHCEKA